VAARRVDSAWLTTAAGVTSEHRRDARTALRLLVRTLVLHARLVRRWPALCEQYRRALPDLVSPASWERTLAPTPPPPGLAEPGVRPAA
jgi:galactofuranosylgalactofuranosylrhamnosyl-N-acetylglucosaminyl-diphospho-decaprenol beta-1,5/1,6-galactofuranosyltransferase